MERFNQKGMMVIPVPKKVEKAPSQIVIIKECFCHNQHNLVSKRTVFDTYNGILVKIRGQKGEGFIALSPVCGHKSKVIIDTDLVDGEILEILCPTCNEPLKVYSPCDCGGSLFALFYDMGCDFSRCIGICNRVGCQHAEIKDGKDLFQIKNLEFIY